MGGTAALSCTLTVVNLYVSAHTHVGELVNTDTLVPGCHWYTQKAVCLKLI